MGKYHVAFFVLVFYIHYRLANYILCFPAIFYLIPIGLLIFVVIYKVASGQTFLNQINSLKFIAPLTYGLLFMIVFFEVPGFIILKSEGTTEVLSFEINSVERKGNSMRIFINKDSIREYVKMGFEEDVCENPERFSLKASCREFCFGSFFVERFDLIKISEIDSRQSSIDTSRYILTGDIFRKKDGLRVPHDRVVTIEVYQNGSKLMNTFENNTYSVELNKGQDAVVVLSSEGCKTKKIYLPRVNQSEYHIFKANCVFEEGSGITERTLNLDSLARGA